MPWHRSRKNSSRRAEGRLLEEFRGPVAGGSVKAMQSLMLASKADFTELALKEFKRGE